MCLISYILISKEGVRSLESYMLLATSNCHTHSCPPVTHHNHSLAWDDKDMSDAAEDAVEQACGGGKPVLPEATDSPETECP